MGVGLFSKAELQEIAGYSTAHQGLFYSWGEGGFDCNLLVCRICCVLWVFAWVSVIMTPFFIVLNMLGMFRVDALEEDVGLDISHHRGSAYDLSGPKTEDVEELMVRRSTHGKGSTEVPPKEEA